MKGYLFKPHCKCPGKKDKKCSCGATWSYMIDVGINPKTGKRKQKKKGGFRTKGEAEAAAALLHVEVTQGTYVNEENTTFEEFCKTWIGMYSSTGRVKISTVRVRNHEISRLIPYFGKLKMKSISRVQYQDALNNLKEKGYADNTLDGVHRTGRMIFKKAVELGVIKIDPTEYAYIPKIQKTVDELEQEQSAIKYLEKEQLSTFLKTAQTHGLDRDFAIFVTLAYTGIRAGELCALKWRDVDFQQQTISITKTYYNPTNNRKEYKLLPPKTKSAKRTIDVDKLVFDALSDLQAAQDKVKMRRRTYHDQDFVFAKLDNELPGYPEYIKFIENRMHRLLKIAGLNESLTPHSLRHTHTSLLAEAGVELQEIMDRLGHKDDATTKNVYLHVTKPKKKEASQKFAELMRGL